MVSAEKFKRRRSIMRKPSFLDIDDDKDTDVDDVGMGIRAPVVRRGDAGKRNQAQAVPLISENSFLDLDRESFDTSRSSD